MARPTLALRAVAAALAVTAAGALSNYGAFGKWTLASSSFEMAEKSLDFAVRYLNVIPIIRNESKTDYMLVGPTGCDKVRRQWGAQRFLIGDNHYHWVWDTHAVADTGAITVEERSRFLRRIAPDLIAREWNEWMDYHYGSWTDNLDHYLALALADNVTVRLISGFSEQLHDSKTSTGEVVYSMFMHTPDGALLEMMSDKVSEDYRPLFQQDTCHFRPIRNFRYLNLTDWGFERYSVEKLGAYTLASAPREEHMVMSAPHHTSVVSLDPEADASFLNWLMDAHVMNGTDVPSSGNCGGRRERWVRLSADGGRKMSNDHYVVFVHNPSAKVYPEFTTGDFIKFLARDRAGLGDNEYTRFMDDHLGFDLPSAKFALIANRIVEAGVPFLTRREPAPSKPSDWELFEWEKFSIFVQLPGSHLVIQLQTCCVSEEFFQLPFTFCDWDFCDFENYRNVSAPRLVDPTSCGYSAMSYYHPALNWSSVPIPQDDGDGTTIFLSSNGTTTEAWGKNSSTPPPGSLLAAATAASTVAARGAQPPAAAAAAIGGVAVALVAAARHFNRRQYSSIGWREPPPPC